MKRKMLRMNNEKSAQDEKRTITSKNYLDRLNQKGKGKAILFRVIRKMNQKQESAWSDWDKGWDNWDKD